MLMYKKLRDGRKMPILAYLKTRLVTPRELLNGFRNPVYHLRRTGKDGRLHLDRKWFGMMLFNARYNALKAIDGHDFWDAYPVTK